MNNLKEDLFTLFIGSLAGALIIAATISIANSVARAERSECNICLKHMSPETCTHSLKILCVPEGE